MPASVVIALLKIISSVAGDFLTTAAAPQGGYDPPGRNVNAKTIRWRLSFWIKFWPVTIKKRFPKGAESTSASTLSFRESTKFRRQPNLSFWTFYFRRSGKILDFVTTTWQVVWKILRSAIEWSTKFGYRTFVFKTVNIRWFISRRRRIFFCSFIPPAACGWITGNWYLLAGVSS